MKAIRDFAGQTKTLFGKLTPSQRITLLAVPAVLLVGFALLAFRGGNSGYEPVLFGASFKTGDLPHIEQLLKDKGIAEFRRDGMQLLVPAKDIKKANREITTSRYVPDNWASGIQSQVAKQNLFTSESEKRRLADARIATEIRGMLTAVDSISDVRVTWNRPKQRTRWNRDRQPVTAVIALTPHRNRQLTQAQIQMARAAVARSVGMEPRHVTVIDTSNGLSYDVGDEDSAFDGKVLSWIKEHTQTYRDRIARHLSYIPEVMVTVHVDVENLKKHVEHSQEVNSKETAVLSKTDDSTTTSSTQQPSRSEPGQNSNRPGSLRTASSPVKNEKTEKTKGSVVQAPSYKIVKKEYVAGMPKAVQVSVAVPDSYYEAVAEKRGIAVPENDGDKPAFLAAVGKIRTELEGDIEAQVMQLLPAGSPANAISVKSYTPVATTEPPPESGFTGTALQAFDQWGSAIALGVLALLGIWMLYRTMPKTQVGTPEGESPAMSLARNQAESSVDSEPTPALPGEMSQRDRIQAASRDNPEVIAALLTRWLEKE